jgi:hypothetical protein
VCVVQELVNLWAKWSGARTEDNKPFCIHFLPRNVEVITHPNLLLLSTHLHFNNKNSIEKHRSYGLGSYWKFPGGVEVPRRMERTLRSYVCGKNSTIAFIVIFIFQFEIVIFHCGYPPRLINIIVVRRRMATFPSKWERTWDVTPWEIATTRTE